MSDQLDRISKMPDVAAYVGVGDGSVADAVTALIGSRECLRRERDELLLSLRNVLALSMRMRRKGIAPEEAAHFIRFCDTAGVRPSVLREGE